MPPPSILTIQLVPNSVANSVSVSIPQALQTFETSLQGSAADQAVRNIFRAGCFVDGQGRWFSAHQIISIVAS